MICNRKTEGPMPGNHAYFWNPWTSESCGMGASSSGKGPHGTGERGPDCDCCRTVDGTDGMEQQLMNSCMETANEGLMWFPGINDCHEALDDCLAEAGVENPGAPGGRVGDIPAEECESEESALGGDPEPPAS